MASELDLHILQKDEQFNIDHFNGNFQKIDKFVLEGIKDTLLDMVYPVGSIYMSVEDRDPSKFLGGTWVAWGQGRVPVSVDSSDNDFKTVEQEGGSKLLPDHKHSFANLSSTGYAPIIASDKISALATAPTQNTSASYKYLRISNNTESKFDRRTADTMINSGAETNPVSMQPYITCYMWKRTA